MNFKEKEETINQRIKRYRKLSGYTQGEVAEEFGLKLSTYSQRERKGNVECDFLIKLSRMLDLDIRLFLYDSETLSALTSDPIPDPPPGKSEELTSKKLQILTMIRNLPKRYRDKINDYVYKIYLLDKYNKVRCKHRPKT